MCGIVGYVTSKNKTDYEKFFKQALIADVLRGFDSTGVIIGDDREYAYYKRAVNAIDFLDMRKAGQVINGNALNRPAFAIGHNRAATVGNVNSANAHPFEQGDLIGVHNGTLRTYHRLDKSRDFDTDSETLYYNLSKRDDIADVLGDVKGAYALVWYNSAEGTVNIIRNDERPLTLAKVKDEDTVLWASEPGMLRWLAARNNIKIENTFEPKANLHVKFHIKNANVAEFEFEQLEVKDNYPSYNPPAKRTPAGGSTGVGTGSSAGAPSSVPEKAVIRDINLDKSKIYEVFGFRFEAYAVGGEYGKCIAYMVEDPFLEVHIRSITKEIYQNQYEDNCFKVKITDIKCPSGNYWEAFAIGHKYNQSIAKADGTDDKTGNAADNEAVYNGPAGNFVTKVQMLDLVKDGCMMCNSGISLAEFDFIDWVDGKPVCPDCIEKCNEMMEA